MFRHERFELEPGVARRVVEGDVNVYFSLFSLIVTVISSKWAVHALSLAIFASLCIYANWQAFLHLLKVPLAFLVPSAAVLCFVSGAAVAAGVALRAISATTVLFYLVMTSPLPEVFSALKKLRLPGFIVEICMLVYRAIQVLYEELERLEAAADARLGFSSRKAVLRTATFLSYSLFLKSLRRADIMNKAMEARCYRGEMPTFSRKPRNVHLAALLSALLLAGWLV